MDRTVAKALSLMELLAGSAASMGVTEIARTLGLSKSNVHRLLQTLAARGYVTAFEHRYAATTKVWELGAQIIARLDIVQVAAKVMQRLVEQTDETAHLSILDIKSCEVLSIHNVESTQPVRAYSRIGGRAPAHCVATGKALLAAQPPDALMSLPRELQRFTPHTVWKRDDLLAVLEKVRADGYARNVGEWREQVGGAATVIYDHTDRPIAALGLTVPVERLSPVSRYVPHLLDAAGEVSRLMGAAAVRHRPPIA